MRSVVEAGTDVKKKIVFFFLFSFLAFPLCGEVFTLWPWKGGGTVSGGSLADRIPELGRVLHTERMKVNGIDLELTVSAVNTDFGTLTEFLLRTFQPENLKFSGDTIRVTYRIGENSVERWLMVDGGPGKPVTFFKIAAPEKLPAVTEWPVELPELPPGAVPEQIIYFPDRKAVYGSFRNSGRDPASLLRTVSDQLTLLGWTPLGREAETVSGGSGEIFIRSDQRRILWINYGENGVGAAYARPY